MVQHWKEFNPMNLEFGRSGKWTQLISATIYQYRALFDLSRDDPNDGRKGLFRVNPEVDLFNYTWVDSPLGYVNTPNKPEIVDAIVIKMRDNMIDLTNDELGVST